MINRFVGLALLICCLFSIPCGECRADELSAVESAYIEEMRRAQVEVARATSEIQSKKLITEQKRQAMQRSEANVRAKFAGRNAAENRIAAIITQQESSTRRIDDSIAHVRADIRVAELLLGRATSANRRKQLNNELRMARANLQILQRQRNGILQKGGFEGLKQLAQASYTEADNAYWAARKAALGPGNDYWTAGRHEAYAQEDLEKALAALALLEIQAPQRLARVAPPYLVRLRVFDVNRSTYYYDAAWKDATEETDAQLNACQEAITNQQQVLGEFLKTRDGLLLQLVDADSRWHHLNDQYITHVKREAWGRIGLETLDSILSVLWSDKGNWGVNLGFETVWRLGKFGQWYFGGQSPYFNFPNIAADPQAMTAFGAAQQAQQRVTSLETLGESGLKSTLKEAIKQSVKERSTNSHAMWVYLQAHLMARHSGQIASSQMNWARSTYEFVTRQRAASWRAMFGANWDAKFRADLAKSLGKSVVRKFGVEIGKAWMESSRQEIFLSMFQVDKEYRAILGDIESMHLQLKIEREKLAALKEIRSEFQAERDARRNQRALEKAKNEAFQDRGQGGLIELTFSRPVSDVRVVLDGKQLTATGTGATYEARFQLERTLGEAPLRIEARDRDSTKIIDGNAATAARFVSAAGQSNESPPNWIAYEPGPDANHRPRLEVSPIVPAIARLQRHLGSVDTSRALMTRLYHQEVKKTLEAAMDREGVVRNRNLSTWPDQIYLRWHYGAMPFYTYHADALKASITALKEAGTVLEADMNYIDRGMEQFMRRDAEMQQLMTNSVEARARLGREMDREYAKQPHQRAQAENTERTLGDAVNTKGRLRLFSSLGEPNRIAIP